VARRRAGRQDQAVSDFPASKSSTALPLLALGVVLGAGVAMLVAVRQRAAPSPQEVELAQLDLQLRDELPWLYETSVVVHRPAGEVAIHLHEHGGLPGLRAPLEGPPLDRVDWEEPGGARLRLLMHSLPGGGRTEITVKAAKGSGLHTPVSALGGLDHELRVALAALRKELERTR